MGKIKSSIRADNSVYRIADFGFDDLIISTTELHPFQHTKGHSHEWGEFYLFLSGKAVMMLNGEIVEIKVGEAIEIPPNTFHKVHNSTAETVKFLCVWKEEKKYSLE